ncbi:MAG: SDR family NAD(P)-dependent oxidoreductase, partial [Firmicutes bacterium]|nr:SDR family NAD(P)-dependent oxidoreductase [Bacillota bacterium]
KYMKSDQLEILPSDQLALDKSLINNRTDFSFKVPSYEAMVADMKEWIDNHKELYLHYFK